MTFLRPFLFLTVVAVLCAADLWAVAGLLCALLLICDGIARTRHQARRG